MEKEKKTESELVSDHIKKLPPSISKTVGYLRKVILSADREIGERIKWNNPSFYYTGTMKSFDPKEYKREIIVMNLQKERIMLVLPSGAKLNNNSGLMEGNYADGRRLIIFRDLDHVKAREKDIVKIIREWLSMVEK
ncbi:MAG TPA: DUF1801 domain-containing protein [Cyclobacteriaceae bacterium]|nr:DUF1801 domain-containing protein [Cyclobacteriaceae bacterium]